MIIIMIMMFLFIIIIIINHIIMLIIISARGWGDPARPPATPQGGARRRALGAHEEVAEILGCGQMGSTQMGPLQK